MPPSETKYRGLSRQDIFIEFEVRWSHADIEFIEQQLDRLDVRTFYRTPDAPYIGCKNAGGERVVMFLHAGYIEFQRDLMPRLEDLPAWMSIRLVDAYPSVALSTFRPRSSPTALSENDEGICPIHHTVLPLSGICDDC